MKDNNLNESLYKRFGLEIELTEVRNGFIYFIKNSFNDHLRPIIMPEEYENSTNLHKLRRIIKNEACRQFFLDENDYNFNNLLLHLFHTDFNQTIVRLQILINIIYEKEGLDYEVAKFIESVKEYFVDYPMLGLDIRIYKTKPPQLFPSTSKLFSKEINTSLEYLESDKKFKSCLEHFEQGLKEFLVARNKLALKDVVEDLYTACDEVVDAMNIKGKKGFRYVFIGDKKIDVGLNSWQLKIYDETRDWMDKIKHGKVKDYDREDVEDLILLSSRFIQKVIRKTKLAGL